MSHWRKQQHRDPYFRQAKEEGYRAWSAYKPFPDPGELRVVSKGDVVVDLGAAPGSWSRALVAMVGPRGRIIGLDLQVIDPIPGVICLQAMTDPEVQAQVIEIAGGHANVVLERRCTFDDGREAP